MIWQGKSSNYDMARKISMDMVIRKDTIMIWSGEKFSNNVMARKSKYFIIFFPVIMT